MINWEQYMCIPRSAGLSPESKELILSLCTSHDRRLGRNGTDEIKNQVLYTNYTGALIDKEERGVIQR